MKESHGSGIREKIADYAMRMKKSDMPKIGTRPFSGRVPPLGLPVSFRNDRQLNKMRSGWRQI